MAYEMEHISTHASDLAATDDESGLHREPPVEEQQWLYRRLVDVEAFERFLHKRTGTEAILDRGSGDLLLPMLDQLIERPPAQQGAREVVIAWPTGRSEWCWPHTVGAPTRRSSPIRERQERATGGGHRRRAAPAT